jgi:hypothetical protein
MDGRLCESPNHRLLSARHSFVGIALVPGNKIICLLISYSSGCSGISNISFVQDLRCIVHTLCMNAIIFCVEKEKAVPALRADTAPATAVANNRMCLAKSE